MAQIKITNLLLFHNAHFALHIVELTIGCGDVGPHGTRVIVLHMHHVALGGVGLRPIDHEHVWRYFHHGRQHVVGNALVDSVETEECHVMGILETVTEGKGSEVHLDGSADGWIGGEYLPLLLYYYSTTLILPCIL